MAAPTVITQTPTAFNTTDGKTVTLAAATAGDYIIVTGLTEDSATNLALPTATGTTFSQAGHLGPNNYGSVYLWTAPVTTTGSTTVTLSRSGGAGAFGADVLLVRGVTGFGTAVTANVASTAPALEITTAQANSLLVYGFVDWTATDGAARQWRTTAGATTEDAYALVTNAATFYAGRTNDAGAAGAKTVGLTAPTGQKSTQIGIEVKGTAGGGNNYTATPADPVGVTDAVARTVDYTRTIADPVGVTDVASSGGNTNYTGTPTDAAGVTDAVTTVMNYVRQISDPVAVTDTDNLIVIDVSWLLDDPVGVTDTATRTATVARGPADATGLTDQATAVLDAVRTAADSVGLADQASRTLDAVRSPADAVGVTDALTVVLDRVVVVTDNVGAADLVTASLAGAGSRTVADIVGLTDAIGTVVGGARTPSDVAGVSDQATATMAAVRPLSDTAGLVDAVAAVLDVTRAGSDAVGITDAVTAVLTSVKDDFTLTVIGPHGRGLIVSGPHGRNLTATLKGDPE